MTPIVALLAAVAGFYPGPIGESLPTDPLQRVAYKVVVQERWECPMWKRKIYEQVLCNHLTAKKVAKRTTYCPRCSGSHFADGDPVRLGGVSASPNIPMHALIWLETDGFLRVKDRGGLVKVGTVMWKGKEVRCTRPPETANFDVWKPSCVGDCWNGPGTKRDVHWTILPE